MDGLLTFQNSLNVSLKWGYSSPISLFQDVSYHAIAAAFYLSAAVPQALMTIAMNPSSAQIPRLNIAAVVCISAPTV